MKTIAEEKWEKLTVLLSHEEDSSPKNLEILGAAEKRIFAIMDNISLDCDYHHATKIKEEVRERFYHKTWMKGGKWIFHKRMYFWGAMVASISLLIGIFLFNRLKQQTTIKEEWIVFHSQNGISEIILPDSSVVILNKGSKLSYSTLYNIRVRDIKLDGEACFHVKRNKEIPFIVKTDQIDIKVLGTVFNVLAYSEDRDIVTSLISGSVDVKENQSGDHYLLKPSVAAIYDKNTQKVQLAPFEEELAIGWIDGKLIFKKRSFKDICKSLERKFGYDITINKSDLEEKIFTGKFIDGETLSQILNIICINVPFKYQIMDNKVIIY